jgi:hypothetical protein
VNRVEAKAAALRFCNDIRADQGRPPIQNLPPGSRGDGAKCPIAHATGLLVDTVGLWANDEGLEPGVFIPPAVQQFVEWFDTGQYPELEG